MLKESRGIQTVDEFNDYATEMFEEFLLTFTIENGLLEEMDEFDKEYFEGPDFFYSRKGQRLADKYFDLLFDVGVNNFPYEVEFIEISTKMFQD